MLEALLQNQTMPLLTAFLLGLMTIISPCPFCSNLTAVGYISKDMSSRRRVVLNGVMYALGKVIAYTALSLLFIGGAQAEPVQRFFEHYGEPALGPFLIVCGLFMLIGGHHERNDEHEHNHGLGHRLAGKGGNTPDWLWSLVLGIVFSLAFCPYSGVLYFGMLIPMTMAQPVAWSWMMPVLYGLGTGLPVVLIAWLLAYSVVGVGRLNERIRHFELWLRRICAGLFILTGIALCIWLLVGHHHLTAYVPLPAVFG